MQKANLTPEPADLALIGKCLDGKYLIQSFLAKGGMGVLYKAEQVSIERAVTVKIAYGSVLSTPGEFNRFAREAKSLATLNHPNIVAIHDLGFLNQKVPYIVMEYIKGRNLAEMVKERGHPSIRVAARIMAQICAGLKEAHKFGIIHRDIKPENIVLQDDIQRPDWVKVVDFGIAHLLENNDQRLTSKGSLMGTLEYVAPELLNEMEPDNRCDIYSLGVVIFELLTGDLPFSSTDVGELIAKVLMHPAPCITSLRPDITKGSAMESTISRCLVKDPNERFQTVSEVIAAVQDAMR